MVFFLLEVGGAVGGEWLPTALIVKLGVGVEGKGKAKDGGAIRRGHKTLCKLLFLLSMINHCKHED